MIARRKGMYGGVGRACGSKFYFFIFCSGGKEEEGTSKGRIVEEVLGFTCIERGLANFPHLGPVLVSPSAVPDPTKLTVRGLLNGEERQPATPIRYALSFFS